MGVDDMAISLAISYIAGNIPQLNKWFEGNPSLQKEMDKCYDSALKKWTVNSGIRDLEKGRETLHLNELKELLAGGDVDDKGHLELVRLWIQEMRGNEVCYNFILEHKSDLMALKLDGGFARIAQMLQGGVEELRSFRQENREQMQQMMDMLQSIKSAQGNISDSELAGKVKKIIEDVVSDMIESLRLESAKELIASIERAFSTVIEKNDELRFSFLNAKGDCLSLSNVKAACEAYHQAYLIRPNDERLMAIEMNLLRKTDLAAALKLAQKLPENNISRRALEVACSDKPEEAYRLLPDAIKSDYTLRYHLLVLLGEKGIDTPFLFDDEALKEESSLNFHNMFSWLYMMTWHTVRMRGELRLSDLQPVQPEMYAAFETSKRLMGLLKKTEVSHIFAMAEAHHCYWGFVIDRNPEWINSIHQIQRSLVKEQATLLNMMEISMLVIAKRFNEAFQMVATIREEITPEIADYIILMGYHSNDMKLIGWVINLVKEKPFKLSSSAALHIAFCIYQSTASEILQMLDDDAFENANDAFVLKEMCHSYDGRSVDVEGLKAHLDSLTDDMTAYAAQVLSKAGEAQMAFDLLQPKVADGNSGIRQRIFIDIMYALPEKHPELYKMLVENRKKGNPCDDELLSLEYSLDTRVGDYENAFEAISILYKRRPQEEAVLVNYLRMLGRFDAKALEAKRDEVLNFKFSLLGNVEQVYQIYMENKCEEIAADLLYNFVNASTDMEARTFYYIEAVTGKLSTVVNQKYPIAKEGLYAVCDRGDGERVFFKVDIETELGETLMGLKEGDRFTAKEDGIEGEYVLIHIVNKYGRLAAEISLEVAKGNNPHFKVMHIDMEKPLESLLEQIAMVSPDSVNYHKNKQLAEKKYEKGEIGILNFVSDDDLIGDYYSRLFSPSKVYVAPCQVLDGIVFQGGVPTDIRYVLDITGLLALFEYHLKTGYQYQEKFIIPSTTYEFVVATLKNSVRLALHSYSEALGGGAIVRFKNYIDMDLEIRMKKLLKWMDDNCDREVSDKFLTLDAKEQKSFAQVLTMNTLTLMLNPNRCLITDDQIIEKTLRLKARAITTETFMLRHNGGKDIAEYRMFLADCNYIGVFLKSDFIYEEYMKMEHGRENKFTYIMQNAAYNEILVTIIIRAALRIAANAKDKNLATMTLTNLLSVMIKALKPEVKSYMVATLMESLPKEYSNSVMVRQCLQDAARINNVILLPKNYRL